jgi:protein PhnA
MTILPPCSKCQSALTYEDGSNLVCPECGHEWSKQAAVAANDDVATVRDAHGHNIGEMKLKSEFE